MLKVFKRKAMEQREQQASIKIDMALLLKMDHTRSSEVLKTNIPLTRSSPVPVPVSVASVTSTVALPSSESSSCSVGSKDGPKFLSSSNQERTKRAYSSSSLHEIQQPRSDSSSISDQVAGTVTSEDGFSERQPKKHKIEESQPLLLLGRDDETSSRLKPVHAFIRQQIEVFAATAAELAQPAPGRKHPIIHGQVGIRCRHCRHLPVRDRVKRAVCYPSKVKKIYHSVSDMKFAHFTQCQELPHDVRAKFVALREESKTGNKKSDKKSLKRKGDSSSCSTAKYYEESALNMGMMDGSGGIFMSQEESQLGTLSVVSMPRQQVTVPDETRKAANIPEGERMSMETSAPDDHVCTENSLALTSLANLSAMTLATPEDAESLNPLHCFVRKQLELFAANETDVAAPAPGRKTPVVLGQVGIRCRHCAKLPAKDRVKRAVCYPPNVQGVYHAVSNMKFDHFGICPALPFESREEFNALRKSSVRRGIKKRSGSSIPGRSSTSDYYEKAAVAKGLVDSDTGIRFAEAVVGKDKVHYCKGAANVQTLSLSGLSALAMAACHAV